MNDDIFNDYVGDDDSLPAFGVIGSQEGVTVMENAFKISLERISAKAQTREAFDEEHISSLAVSLQEQGLINPIRVKDTGDGYEIIAGECRFRAAQKLGWTEIACIVDDGDILTQIVENTHRKELNAVEEAKAYKQAMEQKGLNGKQLGEKLGINPSTITRCVRLLQLPEDILELVIEDKISKTVLREIQKVKDPAKQRELVNQYLQSGGSHTAVIAKVNKKKAGQAPARGVKKEATIDDIDIKLSSRKKKTIAELAAAARSFADRLESKSRSRAA